MCRSKYHITLNRKPQATRNKPKPNLHSTPIQSKMTTDDSIVSREHSQTRGNVYDPERAKRLKQWAVSPKQLKIRQKSNGLAFEMARERAGYWEAWTHDESYRSINETIGEDGLPRHHFPTYEETKRAVEELFNFDKYGSIFTPSE